MPRPARCRHLPLFLLAAAVGCGGREEPAPQASSEPAAFTILGRWSGALELSYGVEDSAGDPALAPAAAAAAGTWNASGIVSLHPAVEGRTAEVTFSFRSGAHGECSPFGLNESLAHAGPLGPPSFVHFDRARDWSGVANGGHSLAHAAAHELGHVLGLGHSDDPAALMYPVPGEKLHGLGRSDYAALHSLYGGGAEGSGDVAIAPEQGGAAVAVLRQVAPAAVTDAGVLDTDGDGDEEVLVWRTDKEGFGSLMVYHFEPGSRLARTVGPVPGVVPPGVPNLTGVTASGERLLVSLLPDGRWLARVFDEEGLPHPRPDGQPLELGAWRDADGDGVWDEPHPAVADLPRASTWIADLDGDGKRERLTRRD